MTVRIVYNTLDKDMRLDERYEQAQAQEDES